MIADLLTNQEMELMIEVLDAEHKRLLPEIHHTDARSMRKELVERTRAIERIVERFKEKLEDVKEA